MRTSLYQETLEDPEESIEEPNLPSDDEIPVVEGPSVLEDEQSIPVEDMPLNCQTFKARLTKRNLNEFQADSVKTPSMAHSCSRKSHKSSLQSKLGSLLSS